MNLKHGITFYKVVASGNDFIIIDNKNGDLDSKGLDYSALALELCPRRTSIGADGILVIESSLEADIKMRIINPDGSEVAMCGNGARCTAYYAASKGWGETIDIETAAGLIKAEVTGNNVKLKMGDPKDIRLDINLGVGKSFMNVHYMDTGVPHVVHIVENIDAYQVKKTGREIREHTMFAPAGTNANFVEVKGGKNFIRTYERGVEDETLACGTGTTASAVTLGLVGMATSPTEMVTKSGEVLRVHYNINGKKVDNVYLEGPARIVYEGRI
jgi:diaminopimelate epimerase